jgi:hypothetical protein
VDAADDCRLIYDPDQTDSDGDGDGDRCDNCPSEANPDQASRDTDALGESCDNCPDTYNKSDEDLDNDGRFDVFEDYNHNGILDGCSTDPATGVTTCLEDRDRDGRLTRFNACEGDEREDLNCNGVVDLEFDLNANGIVDPNEDMGIPCANPFLCPGGYEPGTRGNGEFDTEDHNGNFQVDDTPFPDWIDYNHNTIPDAGEFRAPRGPVSPDSDQDGAGDICDNCPVPNPGQEDRDGDGRGDACDPFDTPTISEFSVTKVRRHVECPASAALCCVDPPLCSCCCVPDFTQLMTAEYDLVTVTAKVESTSGPAGIQVVGLAFEPPSPPTTCDPDACPLPYSLQMFDGGSSPIGLKVVDGVPLPVLSGDAVAGDGIYTLRFYFSTTSEMGPGACLDRTDRNQFGFLTTTYQSPSLLPPDGFRDYLFIGVAVGVQGDLNTTTGTQFPIQGTYGVTTMTSSPCGPPTGNGGCLPGSGGTP